MIGHTSMIKEECASGALITLDAFAIPSPHSYFLVSHPSKPANPRLTAFKDWVIAKARDTARFEGSP